MTVIASVVAASSAKADAVVVFARLLSMMFGARCASGRMAEWFERAKGRIHPDHPRGWFHWYCRYYMRWAYDSREL